MNSDNSNSSNSEKTNYINSQNLKNAVIPLNPTLAVSTIPSGFESRSEMPQSIGEVWKICLRHRRWMLGGSIAIAALSLLSSLRTTPLYESTASLELYTPPSPINYSQQQSTDSTGYFFDISRVNTQKERLLSTPVLQRTLATSDLAIGPMYHFSKDPSAILRGRIDIDVNKDNYVFTVSLRDEDKLRATRGLQALLAAYYSEQEDRAGTRANSNLSYLQQQVEIARHHVDASREEEQIFKRDHDILSTDPEENLHARTLRELTSKRSDLVQKQGRSDSLVAEVSQASGITDISLRRDALLRIDSIGTNLLVQKEQELLLEASTEAQRLRPKYGPKHPRMKEAQLTIESRLAGLDQAIASAREEIISESDQLMRERKSLDILIDNEGKALSAYRADLNRLEALTSRTKTDSDIFDELMRNQREEGVVARLDAKQVLIDSPPSPAFGPVNVHVFRSSVLSVFFGICAGVGIAILREILDRNVHGSAFTRDFTGLPILGSIPTSPLLPKLYQGDAAVPEIAAAFRALREHLILSGVRVGTGRCLVVTSPSPSEGKTSVAAWLSMSLASAGARVLLIDADMRHPSQHEQLGIEVDEGLSSLLAGSDHVSPIASDIPNLDFLGVGAMPPNPSELLYSPHLSAWLGEARNHYDYIICDTPPLLVTDPLIIGEQADGIILVLREQHTTKVAIREAMVSLQPLRDRVIGFVLNDSREDRVRDRYYYYGYGQGRPDRISDLSVQRPVV
jgi:succinoglycan biosynthesis transport protein ExoP